MHHFNAPSAYVRWLLPFLVLIASPSWPKDGDSLKRLANHLEAQAFVSGYQRNLLSSEVEHNHTHLIDVATDGCILKYKIAVNKSERKSAQGSHVSVQFSLADVDKVLGEISDEGAPSYDDAQLQHKKMNWTITIVFSYPAATRELEGLGIASRRATNVETIYMASEGAMKKAAQLFREAAKYCKKA
jgi:hypothetical protein